MSPRISVVRSGVRGEFRGADAADARRLEPVAGFCWAAPGKTASETAKQQQAKRIGEKEIMAIPLSCHYIPFLAAAGRAYRKMLFSFSKKPDLFFGFSLC